MKNRRVYVDFDDVLCETANTIMEVANRRYGRAVRFDDIHSFNIALSFDLTQRQVDDVIAELHEPDTLLRMPMLTGARDTIARWQAQGCEIVVVTGRPPPCREASEQWLEEHAIPYAELIFVDKYSRHGDEDEDCLSLPELKELDFCLAVEDSPEMAAFLAREMGIPTVLFARPWNAAPHATGALPQNVRRCGSWQEISEAIPEPGQG